MVKNKEESMEKILRVKQIAKELNISKSTACRLVKQVNEHYGIDPKRMPVEGSCPEWAFNEYFQLDKGKGRYAG
ncbi:MAG: helix-turn-helix domain-containing protein [Erysipelotrichaceae bacterium]|nr:helix-turn-helix domain-containing protein [Clostridia bacterium]MBQ6216110.1 helix-turn-helix domain-containing protein [Erysipelotrichaceae bacterium]